MTKPPTFSMPLTGNEAQQYLNRARMFRNAAIELSDYSNGEQNLPKYALLTHAIELCLKAFAFHSEAAGQSHSHISNHDLQGWYQLALQYGLPDDLRLAENISRLHDLHFTHFTRYPKERLTPVPDLSAIADDTVDHLISTFTPIINPP
jgi:hypothetical protein